MFTPRCRRRVTANIRITPAISKQLYTTGR
jgi:hypothetical protein